MQQKINWLASYPKSGNTWVRTLIEAYFFDDIDINDLRATVGENRPPLYQHLAPIPYDLLDIYQWALLRPATLVNLIALFGSDRRPLIVKTHNINAMIKDMPLFPEGLYESIVYLVRDPRDVAVSYAKHLGISLDDCIEIMMQTNAGSKPEVKVDRMTTHGFISRWDSHVYSWNSNPKSRVIKYEDLVHDTVGQFTRILERYGIEPSQEKVEHAVEACKLKNLREKEIQGGFDEASRHHKESGSGFFSERVNVGRWKDALSTSQVKAIEDAFGEQMAEFGYV